MEISRHPYYAVIGGWITRYVVVYLANEGRAAASNSFFTDFITNPGQAVLYAVAFMLVTAFVVFKGVEEGIEKCSSVLMPVMMVMIVAIAIFALTLKSTDADGVAYAAERAGSLIPATARRVVFTHLGGDGRRIEFR